MRRIVLPGIALAVALAAPGSAFADDAHAHHGGATLSATLIGGDEVDAQGAGGKGDLDGTGRFSGRLVPGEGKLCYVLTWSGIDAPTMAHIHGAPAGANGPVVLPLPDLAAGEHCIAMPADKAAAVLVRPQDFYVNIHNAAYPAGAVRGQLTKN